MVGRRKLALLLVAVALGALAACASETAIPPCTPVEGSDVDPCEPGAAQFSNPRGSSGPGSEPVSIQSQIDAEGDGWSAAHFVVRGTYLPNTVRCIVRDDQRSPPFLLSSNDATVLRCLSDIRVNDYIVGVGPSTLTVLVFDIFIGEPEPLGLTPTSPEWLAYMEEQRLSTERALLFGGSSRWLEVSGNGIGGREKIMFIGVGLDYAVETLEVYDTWDLVQENGTTMVYEADRNYWISQDPTNRSKVEWTLAAFMTQAVSEHNARNTKHDGRIASGTQYPRIIANASQLHQAYIDTGAINHPDGPPDTEHPPACGKAVTDYGLNPNLTQDCMTLLEAKDELRGSAALNWSVDVAMAEWEGITTGGGRVTQIIFNGGGMTGTVPPELSKLRGLTHLILQSNQLRGVIPASLESLWQMETLRLSGNSLTGCIPAGLRDVPNHDLDHLGLPDCAAE